MLRIGEVTVDPPLLLAPMAGVTDQDFRQIVRRLQGVGLVSMEFVSSRALAAGSPKAQKLLAFSQEERPLAVQIFGSDTASMVAAARIVERLGADVCDINMGCPANKVLKGCAGAALMADLYLAEEIIAGVREVLSIPLTVKFRTGLDEARRTYLELGQICQRNGVQAVTLHARTARQAFSGEADWTTIARLKESLDIPVIGNGDVSEPGDALRMLESTGCDGVMIGRAATRNPWIFSQTAARISGRGFSEPTLSDRRDLILDHFRGIVERDPSSLALHKLRKFTGWYTRGLPNGRQLRRRINDLPDPESFLSAVETFFEDLLIAAAA